MTSDALRSALEKRFLGDRTGACVAAAVIEGASPSSAGTVSRAFVCANPAQRRPIDGQTALEIGSVTKTMTGFLLAQLVSNGKLSLEDPLARHLPRGTQVPDFKGQPIRLKHLTTHTSGLPGLPARMPRDNPDNPYAGLTEADLLASLGEVTLEGAPGSSWAYSNFGVMVLSYVLARAGNQDFERLLRERLFRPLGMKQAFINRKPPGVVQAQGHLASGKATSPWGLHGNLAGVGGVRASLDDMVRYAQAALGRGPMKIVTSMAKAQQPVDLGPASQGVMGSGQEMGMGWIIARVEGRPLLAHEGGTGGFSSSVSLDPKNRRAVVLLSDTSLHSTGGLEPIGVHLLGLTPALPGPRKLATPPAELLTNLAGRYRLEGGLGMKVSSRQGKLYLQADGQAEYELAHDSEGDFFPLEFDALLSPRRGREGMSFTWHQGGATIAATREPTGANQADAKARPDKKEAVVANADDYLGEYPLVPGFALTVTAEKGRVFVRGTGQQPIAVEAVDKDVFVAASVGAELTFQRNGQGVVEAVTLKQSGQRLRGTRQGPTPSAPASR